MRLVAFVGFADSGKDTAARGLVAAGYRPIAFADALKDALAAIFRWPRELLEGRTTKSRAWREQVDPWWAEKLGIPQFTPRWAMQNFGTEVMRRHFHPDVWVFAVEYELSKGGQGPVVLTDLRFPNEARLVRGCGGVLIRVQRGADPFWLADGVKAARGDAEARRIMEEVHKVHESEWAWLDLTVDATVENNLTVDDLHSCVGKALPWKM